MLDIPAMKRDLPGFLLCSILLLLTVGADCGPGPEPDDDDATDSGLCDGVEEVAGTSVTLETVATGLSSPVHVSHAGDGSGRVFVVEQAGRIVELDSAGSQRDWLDIAGQVGSGGERGLLSVAFHPAFAGNGRFFVNYTDGSGSTTVSEFGLSGADTATSLADSGSERVLLTQSQPAPNHNGGQLAFGPDGRLYIGLGDGGGGGATFGAGQNPETMLAKILRIDVDSGDPYSVPDDNPFVGDGEHFDETWAWGLRNPWRFSFDRQTGELWIADVGQNEWEEIHIGQAGGNFGWPEMEGNNCFTSGCDPSQFEPAVWEYDHSPGGGGQWGYSITGGHVYRGCRMPDLRGLYFYSDYNYIDSPLWSLAWDGSTATEGPAEMSAIGGLVSSFGEDEQGEIYLCDHSGGRLLKIVPGS